MAGRCGCVRSWATSCERSRAQGVELSPRAVQRLQTHAGGNPLYTRALLYELPAETWHRQDNLPAPRSFATIIRRRVASYSPDAARLLEAVSILGPRSPLATAASLVEVENFLLPSSRE